MSTGQILDKISLELALKTIPSGLFVVDTNMHIVYWNPAAESITGYSSQEAVGQHCSFLQGVPCGKGCGLYNPDIPKPIISSKCTIVTKDGKTVNLLKNVDYLRDGEGQVIGGIESFIDVTLQSSFEASLREQAKNLENRVAERTRELQKSEARFRSVLDNMDDMAYIITEEFKLSFLNRSMLEIFGDQTGKDCFEVLHNRTKPCPWCPMNKVLQNRAVKDERDFDVNGRHYEIVHSQLPMEDGSKQKLAVCRDITERKKAEADLKEANRELDAFAHSISHDLRGILSPVVTYMDFLRLSYSEVFDEQVLQILTEVERQSERAIALLDDLLDLAQVSHIKPAEHPTNVNAIIEEILRGLAREGKDSHEIKTEKLPKSWLPETLIYQLFSNLINNAQHYVPQEAGPIEIGSWVDQNQTTYFVRDYGPGVSLEETQQIFDIFYRGTSSEEKRGTGVGLAIVRKIALRCQGEAWVEKTPGGGATFCISLPKTPAFTTTDNIQ